QQSRKNVERWDDGKGRLAHCEGIRKTHRSGEVGAARSATLCRVPDYAESNMKHLHLALSWLLRRSTRFGIGGMELKAF
ncbi:MAG: hypothetical protein JWO91_1460, partial [Acidobacteriaceae bacterium]|nr:hypothetical protein [Acidobacteriaceae bacterium]